MSTANLGFAIDSSQAANAAADLDRLTSSATKVEQAAARSGAAGTKMSRAFGDVSPALDKIIGSLGRLEATATSIDARLDKIARASRNAAKGSDELGQAAVEASAAYKQLEASLRAVEAAQRKGDISLQKSQDMIEKQRAAIAKLNTEIDKLNNHPIKPPGSPPTPANNNGGNGNVGNIAAQFFDIGTTAAFMNPATVAIQQGPQIAQAFAGQSTKQALSSLAGGLAAIVSPLSLVAVGLTGAAAAAISYGVSALGASDDTKKLEDAMERHDGIIKRLEDRYGSLIDKVKGYSVESARLLSFQTSADVRRLRNATKLEGEDFFGNVGTLTRGGYVSDNSMFSEGFMAFNDAITRLRNEFKAGRPDFEAFYDSIYKTAQTDPQYATKADELAKLVDQFRQGSTALQEMERIQNRLFNDVGPNGMLLSRGPTNREDMGSLALFETQRRIAAQRQRQGFDAQVQGINARSPSERAAAARSAAAAQYNNDETAAERRTRIEQAGTLALVQAERQLSEARRDRASNLDRTIRDQQNENDLIGQTGGAAVALRKEYELTAQLRMEAARQGVEVDQQEIGLIKQKAEELGRLTDAYNQGRFAFEMNQQARDSQLSPRQRMIVQTQRRYGLAENPADANGRAIGAQADWEQNKQIANDFFSAVHDSAWKNGGKIGDAIGEAALQSLQSMSKKLWENVFDRLSTMVSNWMTGRNGGVSGVAANVGSSIAAQLTPANDNAMAAPVGAVTRGPLPTGDIANYIVNAAKRRGIDPDVALRVAKSEGGLDSWNLQSAYVKNGVREQSYGPFQLYKGGGLGNAFQKATGMDPADAASGPAGVDFALDHAKKNGWGAWYGADRVGISKWEGINANPGMASTGADAVNQLAEASKTAAKSVDVFGSGMGKMGNALSAFPAAPTPAANGGGGGGLFGWLGSLFGGFTPNGAQATLAASGSITGMFAGGTNNAPGGLSLVGERGPELLNLPQGSGVVSNHKLMEALSQRDGGQGGIAGIRLFVDQDGNWQAKVEGIAEKKANSASRQNLGGYKQNQQRSGYGDDQKRYMSRKG